MQMRQQGHQKNKYFVARNKSFSLRGRGGGGSGGCVCVCVWVGVWGDCMRAGDMRAPRVVPKSASQAMTPTELKERSKYIGLLKTQMMLPGNEALLASWESAIQTKDKKKRVFFF